ncbi:transglycosylase domain-containing protein [Limnovirga soli]|uniref:Penicillin-binding protein n=1 Tax=Limnovirga soli TaxID=2656915 RepID=A0A8J8FH71_9BACT|nr:transglycosylase domain-containing protein [Limnovirga soli]NNV57610.1 penicillin-binding protein [Limnovirga soli]
MKKSVLILWRLFFIGIGLFILLIVLANFGVFGSMPSIDELQNPSGSQSSQVYADDGTLMGKYYLQDRVNVTYKDISKYVINALVATEDKRFYDHNGIDPRSLARAVFALGSQGGASTISMQTAKNLFTDDPSNNIVVRMIQKLKESIIAIKLERNFTKEEILTLYLNTVAFSDNVFGIRNAAKTFFQKEPDRISIEEAAVLVGMVNAPSAYNPRTYPKRALDRRNLVLDRMAESLFITAPEAADLKNKPIKLNYKKLDETAGLAPYFRMILGEELKKWCKEHKKQDGENYNLYKDGLKIYTTINPRMQLYAEEAVAKHMAYMQQILNSQRNIKDGSVWKGYENVLESAMKQTDRWKNMKKEGIADDDIKKSFYIKTKMKVFAWNNNRSKDTTMTPYDSIKYHRQMLQAGFMAMDPLSGEVKAWVGGIDFKTFKYDHVNINTKRQVGSTIKPLLYSLAIEDAGFTPNTMVEDVQQNFNGYGLVPATDKTCTGQTMPMAQALAQSRNCATAYIMKQLGSEGNDGAKRFVEFLKNCDIKAKVDPYPSIALGAAEISLIEMIQAYSMFPGRGFNVKPMYITHIEDKNGNILQTFIPQRKDVISDVTAYSVIKMMEGVMQFGTGHSIWNYGVSGEIAGKTGTTNDNSDAWFMGYTPQLLCGVWAGCDDRFIRFANTAVGQGASAALPVFGYFYNKASNDKNLPLDMSSTFAKPDVMQSDISYDWINGVPQELGAEGDDIGNGNAADYGGDSLPEIKAEDIVPESEIPLLTDTAKKRKPAAPLNGTQPKAIMPKKETGINRR